MLDPYRRVLATPGALRFSLAGLIGRLPISMVGLGIVLLVSSETGSYGVAGQVSAAFVVAEAAAAVLHGRLIDRVGQARELVPSVVVFCLAVVALMTLVRAGAPIPWPHLAAAVAGATMPQVGPSVRARWSHVLHGERLSTAFAYEAAMDEVIFVVGPTLATMLATLVHPLAGLVTVVVAAAVGTGWLAAQRRTEPPPHPTHDADGVRARRGALPTGLVAPLAVAALTEGALFAGVEVATVAFATENGARQVAGVLLGTWALGSLIAGLATGLVAWRISPLTRLRRSTLLLALTMVPLWAVDGFVVMGAVLFVAGFAISPTLIATLELLSAHVPPGRRTEGMTVIHTGLAIGLAPGAAVAGHLVDVGGSSTAYLVPLVAGTCGVLATWFVRVPAGPPAGEHGGEQGGSTETDEPAPGPGLGPPAGPVVA